MPVFLEAHVRRRVGLTLSAFNQMVRESLLLTGQLWLRKFLPLHFGPQASRRYGYASRTWPWKAAKLATGFLANVPSFRQRYNIARSLWRSGRWREVPTVPAHDPRPLEGQREIEGRPDSLRQMVLGRFAFGGGPGNLKATATRNRQRLRIPVRLPHALNPKNAGEMTTLLASERHELLQFFRIVLEEKLQRRARERGVEERIVLLTRQAA